jgi:hypothetical protein
MSIGDGYPEPPGYDQESYELWLDSRTNPMSDPDLIAWMLVVHGRRLMWAAVHGPIRVLGYWESKWHDSRHRQMVFYALAETGRFIGRHPVSWVNARPTMVNMRDPWAHGCLIRNRREQLAEFGTCRSGQIPCDADGLELYGLVPQQLQDSEQECINASLYGRDEKGAARSSPTRAGAGGPELSARTPAAFDGGRRGHALAERDGPGERPDGPDGR